MTNEEFLNEFDVLFDSITSNQGAGLTSYEKSVLATKAQDEILKSYFDFRLNKPQEGFDSAERRQIDFSMITVNAEFNRTNKHDIQTLDLDLGDIKPIGDFVSPVFDTRPETLAVNTPNNILMIINEYVEVTRNNKPNVRLDVSPITYTEYSRLMSKPFKRPLKWQAWRLINSVGTDRLAEIIVGPKDIITKYSMRYIKKPRPMILDTIDDLTIENTTYEELELQPNSPCSELDPILHQEILQRAVEHAAAIYKGDLSTQIGLGTNSQTNIGMLTGGKSE